MISDSSNGHNSQYSSHKSSTILSVTENSDLISYGPWSAYLGMKIKINQADQENRDDRSIVSNTIRLLKSLHAYFRTLSCRGTPISSARLLSPNRIATRVSMVPRRGGEEAYAEMLKRWEYLYFESYSVMD